MNWKWLKRLFSFKPKDLKTGLEIFSFAGFGRVVYDMVQEGKSSKYIGDFAKHYVDTRLKGK